LNQQLAAPCGHICAKLLSDCKEFVLTLLHDIC